MYIPDTIPSTLTEMYAFLAPSVTDGLFDSIEYDNDSNPTCINCIQDSNIICKISCSSPNFYMIPYIRNKPVADDDSHKWSGAPIAFALRCKHGICFRTNVSSSYFYFIFSTTNAGKTGIIATLVPQILSTGMYTIKTVYSGDDTSNSLYTNGFNYVVNGLNDRTIFNTIPVTGNITNNIDYYTGCLFRNCYQFAEDGEQIIDNKKYYCVNIFAIFDE